MSKKDHVGLVTKVELSPFGTFVDVTIRISQEPDKCCDPGMLQVGIYDWQVATKVQVKEI